MRSFILLFCFTIIYSFTNLYSQGLVNNGAEISVTDGALLAICGYDANYINLNDGFYDGVIELAGNIELKGDWINNSLSGVFTGDLTDGNVVFSGNEEQFISGMQATDFENLVIDKSDVLKLNSQLSFIHGDFLIIHGSFDLNNNIVTVSGNWENYDSFDANNGTVIFNGNNTQKIYSGNCNFSEIVFNNSFSGYYDVEICQDIVIDKYAEFNNGIIFSSNNSDIIFSNNALCNGGSDSSFICSVVTKMGEGDFVFPTGCVSDSALIWAPLEISSLSINDIFICQYFDTAAPNNLGAANMSAGLHHVSGVEHWMLNQISGSTSPHITLYSKNNLRSGIINPNDIVVAVYNDNLLLWETLGGSFADSANSGFILSDIPYNKGTFYTFGTKHNSNPLPVSLLDFNTQCFDEYIEIKWSTASECNSDFFILEKSFDLTNWEFVDKIPAAGNSNQLKFYSVFDDKNSIPYIIYYRIKQIDIDGNETVFNPVDIRCYNNDLSVSVFPNPFADELHIKIKGFDGNHFAVKIFDINGKIVYSKIFNSSDLNSLYINFENKLSNGIYFILFELNNKLVKFKLIKI